MATTLKKRNDPYTVRSTPTAKVSLDFLHSIEGRPSYMVMEEAVHLYVKTNCPELLKDKLFKKALSTAS